MCREAKLFIKHLVRGRESEALKSEHLSIATHKSLKINRKTCCQTEDLCTFRKHALLILLSLAAEEAL